MKTITVKSLKELARVLKKDMRSKERLMDSARQRAAQKHAAHVRTHMPVAFGELRASVSAKDGVIVVDAPYAAAVERGSRPHWMPLEPLIRWVKLRGFQGLASGKSLTRMPGTTTAGHARSVAAGLREHDSTSGYADLGDGAGDRDGPVAIAKAIQLAIALKGTKPTWFMRSSIPQAKVFLGIEVKAAFARGAGSD